MNMPLQKSFAAKPVEDEKRWFTLPADAFTLEGFRRWALSDDYPESGRVAYIGGKIFVDMNPARINSHGAVKSVICGVLFGIISRGRMGDLYIDDALVSSVPGDVSNLPDAVFVSYKCIRSGRVRLTPSADGEDAVEFDGAPDWVLEVVSPSSVRKDKVLLRRRYHLAGIPEYWLVDARGSEIDFRILTHTRDAYAEATIDRGGWQRSKVFGRRFRLVRERDPNGQWSYTLQVKR
jgi:Uma2 family endonuclease